MSTKVIGIYGRACTGKSDVARELSRLTGNKVKHPGEAITTRAKAKGLDSGKDVSDDWHREVDAETRAKVDALEELWIIDSALLDAVLGPRKDVYWVKLESDDAARTARWDKRREEGGGRTRQIGESLPRRDADDDALRARLYPDAPAVTPALVIDTSTLSYAECATQILMSFQSETGMTLALAKREMDKSAQRGISPGPSSGTVHSYTPASPPFGGYITDSRNGKDLYVHKSVVNASGVGHLEPGQKLTYEVVEDGFGGFKATKLELAS